MRWMEPYADALLSNLLHTIVNREMTAAEWAEWHDRCYSHIWGASRLPGDEVQS